MRSLEPLNPNTFEVTLALIMPHAEDMKWASIPWQTDLWEARRIAAGAGEADLRLDDEWKSPSCV